MRRLECHRPFFALVPPPDAIAAIAAVRDGIGPRQPIVDERLHMTLLMTDDLPELAADMKAALREVGDTITSEAPGIALDRVAFGPGNAALVPSGGTRGLRALQARLAESLARAGIPARDGGYRFSPHVTLGYGMARQDDRPVDPIRWTATEVVLIDSWLA